MAYCAIHQCNNSLSTDNVFFFRFPSETKERRLWANTFGVKLTEITDESFVCSAHIYGGDESVLSEGSMNKFKIEQDDLDTPGCELSPDVLNEVEIGGADEASSPSANSLCRLCAASKYDLTEIYGNMEIDEISLEQKINKHLPIKVAKTDTLPLVVCAQCVSVITGFDKLYADCTRAEEMLRIVLLMPKLTTPEEKENCAGEEATSANAVAPVDMKEAVSSSVRQVDPDEKPPSSSIFQAKPANPNVEGKKTRKVGIVECERCKFIFLESKLASHQVECDAKTERSDDLASSPEAESKSLKPKKKKFNIDTKPLLTLMNGIIAAEPVKSRRTVKRSAKGRSPHNVPKRSKISVNRAKKISSRPPAYVNVEKILAGLEVKAPETEVFPRPGFSGTNKKVNVRLAFSGRECPESDNGPGKKVDLHPGVRGGKRKILTRPESNRKGQQKVVALSGFSEGLTKIVPRPESNNGPGEKVVRPGFSGGKKESLPRPESNNGPGEKVVRPMLSLPSPESNRIEQDIVVTRPRVSGREKKILPLPEANGVLQNDNFLAHKYANVIYKNKATGKYEAITNLVPGIAGNQNIGVDSSAPVTISYNFAKVVDVNCDGVQVEGAEVPVMTDTVTNAMGDVEVPLYEDVNDGIVSEIVTGDMTTYECVNVVGADGNTSSVTVVGVELPEEEYVMLNDGKKLNEHAMEQEDEAVDNLSNLTNGKLGEEEGHYACEKCGKVFLKESRLKVHKTTFCSPILATCDFCNMSFPNTYDLLQHSHTHKKRKAVTCGQCSLTFESIGKLRNHLRSHSSKDSLVCDVCGKIYRTQKPLINHRKVMHQIRDVMPGSTELNGSRLKEAAKTVSQHECTKCGKIFSINSVFIAHELVCSTNKAVHEGASEKMSISRQYSCETCGKAFTVEGALKVHRAMGCPVKKISSPDQYKFKDCSVTYHSENALQTHQEYSHMTTKQVAPPGGKQFSCTECGKQFNREKSMEIHFIRKHTSRDPYSCNYCGLGFAHMRNLKEHKQRHGRRHSVSENSDSDI